MRRARPAACPGSCRLRRPAARHARCGRVGPVRGPAAGRASSAWSATMPNRKPAISAGGSCRADGLVGALPALRVALGQEHRARVRPGCCRRRRGYTRSIAKVGQQRAARRRTGGSGNCCRCRRRRTSTARNAAMTGPCAWPPRRELVGAVGDVSLSRVARRPTRARQRRSRRAGSCSGTALISSGKLRLMRVATSTGSCSSAGRRVVRLALDVLGRAAVATIQSTTLAGNSASNSSRRNQKRTSRKGRVRGSRCETQVVIMRSTMASGVAGSPAIAWRARAGRAKVSGCVGPD